MTASVYYAVANGQGDVDSDCFSSTIELTSTGGALEITSSR